MNATFDQIARCFAAYKDQTTAFWPFVNLIYFNSDEVHNDPVASAEAMRRMLAVTMADVYAKVQTQDLDPENDWMEVGRLSAMHKGAFLAAAQVSR